MDVKKSIKIFLRALERCVNTAFLAVIILVLVLALYVTSDNKRIVSDASAEVYQWYKPTAETTNPFDELVEINKDVIGWLTIDSTNIDYPLVQGRNNEKYVNTAVTGEFSLSGALFLDYRNSSDFSDPLSIVFGHNMTGDMMFGGLDKYADKEYFDKHLTGKLYHDGKYYDLTVFAYFSADGHNNTVYNTALREDETGAWVEMVLEKSINHTDELPTEGPLLMLSTCSTETTNGRDLLALKIAPDGVAPEKTEHVTSPGRLHEKVDERSLWKLLGPAGALLLLLTIVFILLKRRKRKKNERE